MKKMNFIRILLISFIVLSFYTTSCWDNQHSDTESITSLNKNILDLMQDKYLWYNQVPTNVNPDDYDDPNEFLDALLYKPIDKWSFLITEEEYIQYFVEAKFYGHGFSFGADQLGKLRVAYLFDSTDLYSAGVRRGWIIKKINGTAVNINVDVSELLGSSEPGVTNVFLFEKPDGTEVEISSTKGEVAMNEVLYCDTLHVSDKIVGYLVFNGFIGYAKEELTKAFTFLKNAEANELIVDLRYNGGGDVDISTYLASLIGGSTTSGKLYTKMANNDKNTDSDKLINFTNEASALNLNRVFFITTSGSASASEAVINGLEPFMPVYLIGTQTHGKPVGMEGYQFRNSNYIIFPITFKLTNASGYGDYYDGLPVDKESPDDVTHDFGDRNEECLKQTLYYIQNGSFISTKSASPILTYKHKLKGLRQFDAAY
jgi:carboxyl-terminal processing protease